MKLRAKILSFALVAAMCVPMLALSSCKPGTKAEIRRDLENVPISAERQAAMDSEAKKIRVLFPGLDKSTDEWRNAGVARFEEKTGKTVEYVPSSFDIVDITNRIFSAIASKNPFDAIWAANSDTGLYYVKQYTQPVGDYLNFEWLDQNKFVNYGMMDEFARFDGEYHLVIPYDYVNPFFIFYNKDLVEKFELDDPKELYEKDEWTVSAMLDMAAKATEDADGDGTNDTYGLTTSYENVWDGMNHTSMVKTDNNGKYVLNLDDPAFLRSLDYYRDMMYNKKVRGTQDGMPVNAFGMGKYLFMIDPYWSTWELQQLEPAPTFEWDAVPMPYGEDNPEHYNTVSTAGLAFINGCPNPNTTATLMEYICQECSAWRIEIEEQYINGNEKCEAIRTMKDEMCEKPYYSIYWDAFLSNLGRDMLQAVGFGNDNTTSIEKYRAQYQGELNLINTQVVWPDPVDHDPYVFDFESDIAMFNLSESVKSGELTQATGGDAIEGSSLKMGYDAAANVKTVALATLAEDYRLYGYTTYNVSFDYIVDGEPTEDTQYFVAYYNTETGKQKDAVFFAPESTADGAKHAEITLDPISDNTTVYTMVIGARSAPGGLTIDNLKIEQIRTTD